MFASSTSASRLSSAALVVSLGLLLGGCGGGHDLSDLKQYVSELDSRYKGRVEPLPQIKPYETFAYKALALRDPFQPPVQAEPQEAQEAPKVAGIHPDFTRPKEALELFPLDALRMVGTLAQYSTIWALINASDGTVYRVKPGNYMGQNYGKITDITEARIVLAEMVPNGKGGWEEHQAVVELSEAGGGGKK